MLNGGYAKNLVVETSIYKIVHVWNKKSALLIPVSSFPHKAILHVMLSLNKGEARLLKK